MFCMLVLFVDYLVDFNTGCRPCSLSIYSASIALCDSRHIGCPREDVVLLGSLRVLGCGLDRFKCCSTTCGMYEFVSCDTGCKCLVLSPLSCARGRCFVCLQLVTAVHEDVRCDMCSIEAGCLTSDIQPIQSRISAIMPAQMFTSDHAVRPEYR